MKISHQMTIKRPANREPIGVFASIMAVLMFATWAFAVVIDYTYPHTCWRIVAPKIKGH